jgi:GxxExxY protein
LQSQRFFFFNARAQRRGEIRFGDAAFILQPARGMDAQRLNAISLVIVQSAIEVHRVLGPGLLESVYRSCLCYELRERGLAVATELVLPIHYKSAVFDIGYRIDLLVGREIIVELKSVETVLAVHYAQLLSYLRLADKRLGLFINFNVPVL